MNIKTLKEMSAGLDRIREGLGVLKDRLQAREEATLAPRRSVTREMLRECAGKINMRIPQRAFEEEFAARLNRALGITVDEGGEDGE